MALQTVVNCIKIQRGTLFPSTKKRIILNSISLKRQQFNYSTSAQEVTSSINHDTGVAIMKWNNPPVNSLSFKLLEKSIETIKTLEQDPKCGALILTSDIPNIFCAGLDFKEIHRPQREQYLKYSLAFSQLWADLYGSRLATVIAVNGSSPAGGCMMAVAGDYRIMKAGKGTIGLSEVHLGLPLRGWVYEAFVNVVGHRQAELTGQRGILFNANDALRIGLVDEVVSSDEELLQRANYHAELLAKLSSDARHQTKMDLRQPLLDRMKDSMEKGTHLMVDTMMSEKMQTTLDAYFEKLKKK